MEIETRQSLIDELLATVVYAGERTPWRDVADTESDDDTLSDIRSAEFDEEQHPRDDETRGIVSDDPRVLGDALGHEFHGNQWSPGGDMSRGKGEYYHGTSAVNAAAIQKNGLLVSKAGNVHEISGKGHVYVTLSEKDATAWARAAAGEKHDIAVFKIRIPADDNRLEGRGRKWSKERTFKGDIKPEWIVASKRVLRDAADGSGAEEFWLVVKLDEIGHLIPTDSFRTLKPQVPGEPHSTSGPFGLVFNVNDPNAIEWARQHAAELAKGLSETSEQAIKDAVASMLAGESGYDDILDAVGDSERADMIARTETMWAAAEGQQQGWEQAADAGLLPEDQLIEWIVTSGCCDDCEAMDGQTRPLDGDYDDPDYADGPPGHPRCRCVESVSGQ